jgi:hypothetical protein
MSFIQWEWASHQPMIDAVMMIYHPRFVLELGIGHFSTPLFLKYASCEWAGYESDPAWITQIETTYGVDPGFHDVGNITLATKYENLTNDQIQDAMRFYDKIPIPEKSPRLLFVDQFDCLRMISINALREKFDLIIYHDCNPASVEYHYNLINKTGFASYYLQTPLAWTGLMVRKDIDKGHGMIASTIAPYIWEFQRRYGITGLKLTK